MVEAPSRPIVAESPRDFRGCVGAITANPQYESLRDKLYLGVGGDYHRSYLRNTANPNESEIELLKAVHGDLQNCRKIALAETLQPNERQALTASHAADDKIWAEVLAGRLTWGKFNEGRRVIAMRQQAKLSVASRNPKAELSTAGKLDLGSIDYSNSVLSDLASPSKSERQRGDGLLRRSSYCDRMSNTAYCSTRR